MASEKKSAQKLKDLKPKAQSDKEADKVKGGYGPVDGLKLSFSPVDGKLPPRP